jgi:hypothetical protein
MPRHASLQKISFSEPQIFFQPATFAGVAAGNFRERGRDPFRRLEISWSENGFRFGRRKFPGVKTDSVLASGNFLE